MRFRAVWGMGPGRDADTYEPAYKISKTLCFSHESGRIFLSVGSVGSTPSFEGVVRNVLQLDDPRGCENRLQYILMWFDCVGCKNLEQQHMNQLKNTYDLLYSINILQLYIIHYNKSYIFLICFLCHQHKFSSTNSRTSVRGIL